MAFSDDTLGHFIAGFVSGEGCFYISPQYTRSGRYRVECAFSVKLRADDRGLLELVRKAMMYSGNIYEIKSKRYQYDWDHIERHDSVMYAVRDIHELTTYVIPFFERYPLRGQKRKNYEIWKEIVGMVRRGEHLSNKGWQKILELKERLNKYRGDAHESTGRMLEELTMEYKI